METYEQVYSTFEWEKGEAAAMALTEHHGEYPTSCEIFPYLESCQKRTEDDGYVYPRNATDEQKARIDSQEHYLWEKAGRPGEVNH